MKFFYSTVFFLFVTAGFSIAQTPTSGNPIIKGWHADSEAAIFKDRYWIYPTYSDKYEKQVFFDAFSSKNLVQWKTHHKILDTAAVKWARRAMWAPAIVQKDKQYFLFFAAQLNQIYDAMENLQDEKAAQQKW